MTTTAAAPPAPPKNGVHATIEAKPPHPAQALPAPPKITTPIFPTMSLADLVPSPTNPRTHFDPVKLQQTADSMKSVGVLQPLVVRLMKGGKAEIVAGERRYRAAKLAGLDKVPVVIKQLTDGEVLAIQLIENLQRDDLTAMEEGRGIKRLMQSDPAKHSAAKIAERLGKSEKWVWDRAKLCELIPLGQKYLEAGHMTAGHAILIARLKPDRQKALVEPGIDHDSRGLWREERGDLYDDPDADPVPGKGLVAVSVKELEGWIARHVRFDVDHAAKAAPLEFTATKQAVDAALAKPGKRRKVVQITHDHLAAEDVRSDGGERVYGSNSWKQADGKPELDEWTGKPGKKPSQTCERSALGVFAAGQGYGTTMEVCVDRDCPVHFKREKAAASKAARQGAGAAQKAREAQERSWQAQQKRQEEDRERWKKLRPAVLEAVGAALRKAPIAKVGAFVLNRYGQDKGTAARLLGAIAAKDPLRMLAMGAILRESGDWGGLQRFSAAAGPFGGGIAAAVKKVQTSAPRPPVKK